MFNVVWNSEITPLSLIKKKINELAIEEVNGFFLLVIFELIRGIMIISYFFKGK